MASGTPDSFSIGFMTDRSDSFSQLEMRRPTVPIPHPTGGSFANSLAARNAAGMGETTPLRLSSISYKAVPPSRIITPQPKPGSSCITLPLGVSPTTLMDSPVLVSTNQAEPSPTTGTFPVPFRLGGASELAQDPVDENSGRARFKFKAFSSNQQRMEPGQLSPLGGARCGQLLLQASNSPPEAPQQAAQGQDEGRATPPLVEKPAEDGYNWRKYGQKYVKGSENPRSYYKCTHPNCSVKKKVERTEGGHVTERSYKGTHNHPQPVPARRVSVLHALGGAGPSGSFAQAMANGHAGGGVGQELPGGHAQAESSRASNGGAGHGDAGGRGKQWSGSDQPSGSSDDSADEAHGLAEGGEPDVKRRKVDKGVSAQKVVREPRYVIQATSEVEVLDDGYRWRKYGQKVVKGNPHPRSYYKCTSAGCPVRKHVERSSTDIKDIMTTYEGKHNHDVPATRGVKEDRDKDPTSTPGSGISTSDTNGLPTPISTIAESLAIESKPTGLVHGPGRREGALEDAQRARADDISSGGLWALSAAGASVAEQPGILDWPVKAGTPFVQESGTRHNS